MPLRGVRPPVEGMPKERPVCANCRRPLKFWTSETRESGNTGRVVRRVFERWRGYPFGAPIFDTLRCALDFAVVLHRAGYRRHNP